MKSTGLRACSGLTWLEVLVALLVVAFLGVVAFSAISPRIIKERGSHMLSNMKQLHLATQTAALDGETTGNRTLGWPGDTGGTFTNWTRQIVPAYLGTNDFCKLLSGPGKLVPLGQLPRLMNEGAVLVYGVSSNSKGDAVFLTTANFTNTPSGGAPLQKWAKPYGDKGFIVFRKGGDGAILLKKQVAKTNLIGSYVPLLK